MSLIGSRIATIKFLSFSRFDFELYKLITFFVLYNKSADTIVRLDSIF